MSNTNAIKATATIGSSLIVPPSTLLRMFDAYSLQPLKPHDENYAIHLYDQMV